MTGFELRLWRKSMGLSRDLAAEKLGVCLRAYKDYENAERVKPAIQLSTVALSIVSILPQLSDKATSKKRMLSLLQAMTDEIRD